MDAWEQLGRSGLRRTAWHLDVVARQTGIVVYAAACTGLL